MFSLGTQVFILVDVMVHGANIMPLGACEAKLCYMLCLEGHSACMEHWSSSRPETHHVTLLWRLGKKWDYLCNGLLCVLENLNNYTQTQRPVSQLAANLNISTNDSICYIFWISQWLNALHRTYTGQSHDLWQSTCWSARASNVVPCDYYIYCVCIAGQKTLLW